MWEYAAFILKLEITHRFLEKGHAQNEDDSISGIYKGGVWM